MEIGANTETAVQGGTMLAAFAALVKSYWRDWRRVKRAEGVAEEFKEVHLRLRGHDQELEAHALYDAQNYVRREEFIGMITRLDTKLDTKFDSLNANIIMAIRDGSGRNND